MKTQKKIIIACLMLLAFILICIPIYAHQDYLFGLLNKSEDDIYEIKKGASAQELIDEIISIESGLPSEGDKIALVPYLCALIEKGSEVSAEELIELIKSEETGIALEEALVQMYVNKGADPEDLLELIDNSSIAEKTRSYIVSLGDFSIEELSDVFKRTNDSVCVTAMKRICAIDIKKANELAQDILKSDASDISDSKMISSFLGTAAYYENEASADPKQKSEAVSKIKEEFNTSQSDSVKNQAIYALARICDYDLFEYMIQNDNVNSYLKVTVIERNIPLMSEEISRASSEKEISVILDAMEMHPIIEVGDALKEALSQGKIEESDRILKIIKHIEENGIKI